MNSNLLFSIITFVYGLAGVVFIFAMVLKKDQWYRPARWIFTVGVLGNTAGMALRWMESYKLGIGHAPLSNLYESIIFFAWMVGVLYLFVEWKYKKSVIGVMAAPIAALAMAYAGLPSVNDRIQPLIPALKSNWLIAHVATCMLGYAAFAMAFGISIAYLVKKRVADNILVKALPETDLLDELAYQMTILGFLFLTIGIVTGSVWANSAWGTYWSWDPKETWSLITWLIYGALLHARLMRGWTGTRIAGLSILGFTAVMFTYFGVNLLPGLHSYAN